MSESSKKTYHTHISARQPLLQFHFRELLQYRDLIWLFTKRNFTVTYKQTILGPLWLFLHPLISAVIHAFVFGGIAGIDTDGIPTILFYLCSNAIWIYFSGCVTKNAHTFTANAHVFGKVYFPRLTVPVSNVLSAIIEFCIQLLIVFGFLAFYAFTGAATPHLWAWLLIPVALLHLGALGLGCGIIVSSLTTKYRDLSVLVGFGIQLWMYLTPIVYPLSAIGEGWMQNLLMLNPVTAPVELLRFALLGSGSILPLHLAVSAAVTLVILAVGIIIFNRVEKTFMDTV